MAYVLGAIVILVILAAVGKAVKGIISLVVGLAFIGGIIFALITFGPIIVVGLISIFGMIFRFLLWVIIGLLALGLVIKTFEKMRGAFKTYPSEVTAITVAIIVLISVLINKFLF